MWKGRISTKFNTLKTGLVRHERGGEEGQANLGYQANAKMPYKVAFDYPTYNPANDRLFQKTNIKRVARWLRRRWGKMTFFAVEQNATRNVGSSLRPLNHLVLAVFIDSLSSVGRLFSSTEQLLGSLPYLRTYLVRGNYFIPLVYTKNFGLQPKDTVVSCLN